MDCQPLTKKGSPHHKITGVARANSIQAHTFAENMCCIGIKGRKSETIRASIGDPRDHERGLSLHDREVRLQ
jgi:hypothetical protein